MLHFHMGSQITNIRHVKSAMNEAGRIFVEMHALGANMRYMDVGGGLGVDYEGTRSRSANSINYTIEDYARTVVDTIAEVCDAAGAVRPDIVSESGRAMVAQHAVLVTNVIDTDVPTDDQPVEPPADSGTEVLALWHQFERFGDSSPDEVYRETQQLMGELHQRYIAGEIDLAERAHGESLARALMRAVRDGLLGQANPPRAILDELKQITADKLFINMSVFQSLPDIWAIDQVFPIMPAQRLEEAPTRRGVLRDLTCDSDGRVDLYVDGEGIEHSLPVHVVRPDEEYLLAILMVGAYQEILGDLHNLFGDTGSVDVYLSPNGEPVLGMPRSGDTAEQLLAYVHFAPDELRASYARKIAAAGLDEELYRPATSERVFERLAGLADGVLAAGLPAVVDATFIEERRRRPFLELAARLDVTLLIVHCTAGEAELERRLTARSGETRQASEAGVTIMRRQLDAVEPPSAAEIDHVLVVDTESPQYEQRLASAVERRITSRRAS